MSQYGLYELGHKLEKIINKLKELKYEHIPGISVKKRSFLSNDNRRGKIKGGVSPQFFVVSKNIKTGKGA